VPAQLGWLSCPPALQVLRAAGVPWVVSLHPVEDSPTVQVRVFFASTGVLVNAGANTSVTAAAIITIAKIIFVCMFIGVYICYYKKVLGYFLYLCSIICNNQF
jgi:hypothetical protein